MNVLGVFGGNGVLIYPFKRYLIGNLETRREFKTPGDLQWKVNFPDTPLYTDIKDIKHITMNFRNVNVIVGAPSCGHSSQLAYSRAKKISDPMLDITFRTYFEMVLRFNPHVFLMENLPKSLETLGEGFLEELLPNYELVYHTKSVSEWGNSQINRIRLVVIGINKDHFKDRINNVRDHFSLIYPVSLLKTCLELYGDLVEEDIEIGHIREGIDDPVTIYAGYKTTLKEVKGYWDTNKTLKRYKVIGKKFTTAPGVYRNLDNEYPATARKANRQFNQQGLQLSPRELARIQGVPNRFKIYIDPNKKGFWINKGRATVTKCPPYQIGKWFYKQIKQINHGFKNC